MNSQTLPDYLSFSKLSLLNDSPKEYYKKYILGESKPPTYDMVLGSVLDCLLLEGEGKFKDLFTVSSMKKPTELMGVFVDEYIKHYLNFTDSLHYNPAEADKEAKLIAYDKSGYKLNFATVISNYEKNAKAYTTLMLDSILNNKTIINTEDFLKINTAVNTLKTHNFTSHLFNTSENVEILNQYTIKYFDEELIFNVLCKLDSIIINHNIKTISPIDLKKTAKSVYTFPKSIREYKYHIQSALYNKAVQKHFSEKYPDYVINPLVFVVINLDEPYHPLIWRLSSTDNLVGFYGTQTPYYLVEGALQITKNLVWHYETNNWDYKRECYTNNGVMVAKIYDKAEV